VLETREHLEVSPYLRDQSEKTFQPPLAGELLIGSASDNGSEIHLLEIDVDHGPAQLLGADPRRSKATAAALPYPTQPAVVENVTEPHASPGPPKAS
jgi:hypothetical protein